MLLCYHYTSGSLKASWKKADQKQVFFKKVCFSNIHRKALLLESLFKKSTGLQVTNFIKKRFQHRCFPVNIVKFLRTAFFKDIIEGLFLAILSYLGKAIFQLPNNAFYFEFFNPREH